MLTLSEQKVLNAMNDLAVMNNQIPSFDTLGWYLNLSKTTVYEHVLNLVRKGFVRATGPSRRHNRYVPVNRCPCCGQMMPKLDKGAI